MRRMIVEGPTIDISSNCRSITVAYDQPGAIDHKSFSPLSFCRCLPNKKLSVLAQATFSWAGGLTKKWERDCHKSGAYSEQNADNPPHPDLDIFDMSLEGALHRIKNWHDEELQGSMCSLKLASWHASWHDRLQPSQPTLAGRQGRQHQQHNSGLTVQNAMRMVHAICFCSESAFQLRL